MKPRPRPSQLYNYFVIVSEAGGKFAGAQIARTPLGSSWFDHGVKAQYYVGSFREGFQRWDVREESAIVYESERFARFTMRQLALMAERSRLRVRK